MARHWPLVLLLIPAAILRALYLDECAVHPDFLHPGLDALFHDHMARGWALGDWTLPMGTPDPEVRSTPLQRPIGYPALLALLHALSGGSLLLPRVVNATIALLTGLVLYRGVLESTGREAWAAFATALFLFAPLPLFFEGELVATSFTTLLVTAVAVLGARLLMAPRERGRSTWAVALGGCVCALCLVRPNYGVVALGLPLLALLVPRRGPRPWAAALAALVIGMSFVVVTPLFNLAQGNEPLPMPANGSLTLLYGNNPRATGVDMVFPDDEAFRGFSQISPFEYPALKRALEKHAGHALSHAEVSADLRGRALGFWAEQPIDAVVLTFKKSLLFLGPPWVSNNKVVAIARDESAILPLLPVRWRWLFPLAALCLGLAFTAPRDDERYDNARALARSSLIVLTLALASMIPFVAGARFRAPLVPLLAVLATLGLRALLRDLPRKDRRALISMAGVASVAAVWGVNWMDYTPDAGRFHLEQARAHQRAGDIAQTERALEAAYAAGAKAEAKKAMGYILLERGGVIDAERAFAEVASLAPDDAAVLAGWGAALTLLGKPEEGLGKIDASLALRDDVAAAHYNRGFALFSLGRSAEAKQAYERALALSPEDLAARNNLGRTLLALGDLEGALAAFDAVLAREPAHREAAFNRAVTLSKRGEHRAAAAAYGALVDKDPAFADARLNLCAALAAASDDKGAISCAYAFLGAHPGDLRVVGTLVGALVSSGDERGALDALVHAAENRRAQEGPGPSYPALLYEVARLLLEARSDEVRSPERAAAYAEQAMLALGQRRAELLALKERALSAAGDAKAAAAVLSELKAACANAPTGTPGCERVATTPPL